MFNINICQYWAVVVVKCSAFSPSTPSSNPAEAYSFSVKFVFEKIENEQKEAGGAPKK